MGKEEERARLTAREVRVLACAARGMATKRIAYELGVSSATVSRCLTRAAEKLGIASRTALLQAASRAETRACADVTALTRAEREILGLLRSGLSNAAIARMRSRSERTVANQVASLLRKTKSDSRRALIVAAEAVTLPDAGDASERCCEARS